MYGRKHWRREYSINLGLDASTVWRMSTRAKDIPLIVEVAVRGLIEKHKLIVAARQIDRRVAAKDRQRRRDRLSKRKEKTDERPLETPERSEAVQVEDAIPDRT
jgi:hypothetical protein